MSIHSVFRSILIIMVAFFGCSRSLECRISQEIPDRVSEVRGLPFIADVPCRRQTKASIRTYIQTAFTENNPEKSLFHEEQIYKLLGFVPLEYDYPNNLVDIYQDRILAYYDPKQKDFVTSIGIEIPWKRLVVAHELTHALQDQHFGIKNILNDNFGNDTLLARLALLEGDASSVSKRFALSDSRSNYTEGSYLACDELKQKIQHLGARAQISADSDAKEPLALMKVMDFPYTFGTWFVCAILEHGGVQLLNSAFNDPPNTTREIMHPEIYLRRIRQEVKSSDVEKVHSALELLDNSAEIEFSYTLGEFMTYTLLSSYIASDDAMLAASGWIGDRVYLFSDTAKLSYHLLWRSRWENSEEAKQFFINLQRAYEKRFAITAQKTDGEYNFVQTAIGALKVSIKENQVDALISMQ